MLVTNVGGLPELVPDGKVGKVCEVNVEAIKNGLIDLLAMEDWSGLIAGVKDEKQRFSWETMCEKILEVKSQIPS
jgi:glycosyltransferase involved in cell wall biosynthesis